jgi:hypothetical protein
MLGLDVRAVVGGRELARTAEAAGQWVAGLCPDPVLLGLRQGEELAQSAVDIADGLVGHAMADEEQETARLAAAADRVGNGLALRRVAGACTAEVYHWDEAVLQDDTVDYHFWLGHAFDARTST